jgi:hypothetical protein
MQTIEKEEKRKEVEQRQPKQKITMRFLIWKNHNIFM